MNVPMPYRSLTKPYSINIARLFASCTDLVLSFALGSQHLGTLSCGVHILPFNGKKPLCTDIYVIRKMSTVCRSAPVSSPHQTLSSSSARFASLRNVPTNSSKHFLTTTWSNTCFCDTPLMSYSGPALIRKVDLRSQTRADPIGLQRC